MGIELKPNARGFITGTFKDKYNAECSIQKSSTATEDCIWLGINDPNPQIMASDAKKIGLNATEVNGWVKFPIPEQVLLTTRMHLTRKMVANLLPILQKFVDTGDL